MKTAFKAMALALVCAGSSATGLAQDSAPLASVYTRGGWELGAQAGRYKYEEPGFMNLEGHRGGLVGAYTFANENRLFVRLDLRVSHGILDYEGSGRLEDVPDWITEARAVVGTDFTLGRRIGFSPYIGLGARYLLNDLRGTTTTGDAGYKRIARYIYMPIGATLRLGLGERWALAPSAEYDIFLRGSQRSELTDTGIAGLDDVTNTQNRGNGYRVAVMLETERWSIGPWYQYWHVRDSLLSVAGPGFIGIEPENKSREAGIDIRYRF